MGNSFKRVMTAQIPAILTGREIWGCQKSTIDSWDKRCILEKGLKAQTHWSNLFQWNMLHNHLNRRSTWGNMKRACNIKRAAVKHASKSLVTSVMLEEHTNTMQNLWNMFQGNKYYAPRPYQLNAKALKHAASCWPCRRLIWFWSMFQCSMIRFLQVASV